MISNICGKKWWTRVSLTSLTGQLSTSKYRSHTPRKSLKDFKVDLAKLLVGNIFSQQKRGRSSLDNQQARFVERHFPDFLPMNEM